MDAQVKAAVDARIKREGSQNKAADSFGIDRGLLSRIRTGKRRVTAEVLKKLGFETRITKSR